MSQTVLITGSTSGIGYGLARHFAEQQFNVAVHGLADPATMQEITATLHAAGANKVITHDHDLADPTACKQIVHDTLSSFGRLDVLINNAGFQHVAPVEEFALETWLKMQAVMVTAPFVAIKETVPAMKQQGFGRIINICSAHGLVASPYKVGYVTAKHAIVGMTKTVALELARDNITVNAICPGYVRTPLVDAQIPATAKARNISEQDVIETVILKAQPTQSFVQINEIARIASMLCDPAMVSTTGSVFSVDGGWTAQ
ncbi:MAG: 3-hydroxybutyrate dehydrogenase [Alphaproteobacteria bacterium]|nr:3-hydroxybutyrate dehydrogenase [Alphaproteobacteria bacterium]